MTDPRALADEIASNAALFLRTAGLITKEQEAEARGVVRGCATATLVPGALTIAEGEEQSPNERFGLYVGQRVQVLARIDLVCRGCIGVIREFRDDDCIRVDFASGTAPAPYGFYLPHNLAGVEDAKKPAEPGTLRYECQPCSFFRDGLTFEQIAQLKTVHEACGATQGAKKPAESGAAAGTPHPQSTGTFRCPLCHEVYSRPGTISFTCGDGSAWDAGSWRECGEANRVQHRCAGNHPQSGHEFVTRDEPAAAGPGASCGTKEDE